MDYEKKYKEALANMQELYNSMKYMSSTDALHTTMYLEKAFPELKESEDEKIRNEICIYIGAKQDISLDTHNKWIAWLEKQGDTNEIINRDEFAQGVLRGAAINLITWIDYNTAKGNMCLSNMECKVIEDALVNGDWDSIYAYIKRKLEKQSEHKPINDTDEEIVKAVKNTSVLDMVEPKFHEGEWIVSNINKDIFLIKSVNNGYCTLEDTKGRIYSPCLPPTEDDYHLWTIQDAKDGDVLVASDGSIFIFKEVDDNSCKHYVALTTDGAVKLNEGLEHCWENSTAVHPATKEQRGLLFSKINEAGYKWDADKKKLGKRVTDKGKSEIFTKTMNDEKVSPTWSEEDEKTLNRIRAIVKNDNSSRVEDILWLKSLKERMKGE